MQLSGLQALTVACRLLIGNGAGAGRPGMTPGRKRDRRDMRDEQGQDERHPLHWQTACIAVGAWIVAGAIVAMAWGVLR